MNSSQHSISIVRSSSPSQRIDSSEILLVIVNYNQINEIEDFLKQVLNFWPKNRSLVVDDGSTDGSEKIPLAAGYELICHHQNLGIGAAIRTGINHAHSMNYKAVLIMSSNGKMKASEIERVIQPILDGNADYTTGSRFIAGGASPSLPEFRKFAIPLFSKIATLLLWHRFTDITCGFRCYKIDFLFSTPHLDINQKWLSRYQLEYYIHFYACKTKLRIMEIPVSIDYKHLAKNRYSKIKLRDYFSIILPFFLLRFGIKK